MTKSDQHLAVPARETRLHDGPVLKTYNRRLQAFKRSVSHKCATYFNSLGAEVRFIPTLDAFKTNRKKFLASQRQ